MTKFKLNSHLIVLFSVNIFKKLLKWRNQQKFIKKQDTKIQNLQFPSKIEYDKSNDRVRTPKVKALFG
jgi:hypothetical protein